MDFEALLLELPPEHLVPEVVSGAERDAVVLVKPCTFRGSAYVVRAGQLGGLLTVREEALAITGDDFLGKLAICPFELPNFH